MANEMHTYIEKRNSEVIVIRFSFQFKTQPTYKSNAGTLTQSLCNLKVRINISS